MPVILVTDFINQGNNLLEIEKTDAGYSVRVTDTGVLRGVYTCDLSKERDTYISSHYAQKPTATEINAWLNANRWFTFNNKAGVVEGMLALLPP